MKNEIGTLGAHLFILGYLLLLLADPLARLLSSILARTQ